VAHSKFPIDDGDCLVASTCPTPTPSVGDISTAAAIEALAVEQRMRIQVTSRLLDSGQNFSCCCRYPPLAPVASDLSTLQKTPPTASMKVVYIGVGAPLTAACDPGI
jgi:hypothetical protein